MNESARHHVAEARTLLGRGDEFYRRAAFAIVAAKEADPTLTNAEIAPQLGKGETYVRSLVAAARRATETGEFRIDWASSTNVRTEVAAKVLADAPIEQVERIVAGLPAERRKQMSRALVDTHPANQSRTPLGVGDSVRQAERNMGLPTLMAGPLARLSDAVTQVRDEWDRHAEHATDEEKEIVQEQVRDAVARLLAMNADPQELLA